VSQSSAVRPSHLVAWLGLDQRERERERERREREGGSSIGPRPNRVCFYLLLYYHLPLEVL